MSRAEEMSSSFTEHIYLRPTVSDCFAQRRNGCLTFLLKDTDENPKWNSTEPYFDSLYCNVRV